MIDIATITDEQRVRLLQQELSVVEELCAQLSDEDWDLPTDCPGWSVKDNLSHMIDFEGAAIGREAATPLGDGVVPAHVRNDLGRRNEAAIALRRTLSGKEVLSEWAEIAQERARQLEALDQSAVVPGARNPVGIDAPLRILLMIRLMDLFFHEQDIRRATGLPGHLDGDVARAVFAWMSSRALARALGGNVPDGVVAEFVVSGDRAVVAVRDGTGSLDLDATPTVTIACDLETFICLTGGRWSADRVLAEGRVTTSGDEAAARAVLDNMTVTP